LKDETTRELIQKRKSPAGVKNRDTSNGKKGSIRKRVKSQENEWFYNDGLQQPWRSWESLISFSSNTL